MRSAARLTVGPDPAGRSGWRIEDMVSRAPVAWRAAGGAVYMVSTAAAPVGDDHISVEVRVRPGAAVAVRSSAAGIAWSGHGSCQMVDVQVDPGAGLDWAPEPLITTAGCDHRQEARIRLAGDGWVRWREVVALGRSGEGPGRFRSDLDVRVDGRALLRHTFGVGPDRPGWDGPAVVGGHRAVGLLLVAGAGRPIPRPVTGPGWAASPLAGPGFLVLALGPGTEPVLAALEKAEHRVGG